MNVIKRGRVRNGRGSDDDPVVESLDYSIEYDENRLDLRNRAILRMIQRARRNKTKTASALGHLITVRVSRARTDALSAIKEVVDGK